MSFWSNPIQGISDAVSNPGQALANLDKSVISPMAPAILSAGATMMGVPIDPGTMALILGTGRAIDKGSISEGLNWGMQAYGGAQLGQSALNLGTQEAGRAAALLGEDQAAAVANAQANPFSTSMSGFGAGISNPSLGIAALGGPLAAAGIGAKLFGGQMAGQNQPAPTPSAALAPIQRYGYSTGMAPQTPRPDVPEYGNQGKDFGAERNYFPDAKYVPVSQGQAALLRGYAGGGPIEAMSNANSVGMNTGYPMADINKGAYATPWQTPISRNVVNGAADANVDPMTGEMKFASGGISDLGSYSDGGRLLRGPGDGVSDSIPAMIGKKQPARLADGEFVVPARIVSELGNGSTEAGARKLYAMLDRVQSARRKTVGKGKVAKNSRAERYLPA
jgi:hypothetical protein